MPRFEYGFRLNPSTVSVRHPQLREEPETAGDVRVVSMFAGCGGLDLGLLGGFRYRSELFPAQPFRILAAYDNDLRSIETYRLNIAKDAFPVDLTKVAMDTLPPSDLLIGGFPCQDFSSSGPKAGLEGTRGRLYRVLVEYMQVHQPKVVLAENVPHLAKMRRGAMLTEILRELEAVGYDFKVWNIYCPDYGLPQNRNRLFLVGVRRDLPGEPMLPTPSHVGRHRSIDWAIDDLKETIDETITNQSQYFVATRATAGAGQGDQTNERGAVAYCVRANAKARIHFHYELDRRLTVRECARLQSFPDEFVFPFAAMSSMSQIGNAVPPIVAHAVGRSLADYFASLHDETRAHLTSRSRTLSPRQLALSVTT